jgi:isoleucyl-tRNA synthetase
MDKPFDLKSTLNLPRTDFPMKAKLPEREPAQLAEWDRLDLYNRILDARASAPLYVLHDGPPYPTGDIHLGQALNKILKDLVVKSKTMAGFRAPYVPGWDCHGLPIESKVEKELGGKKGSVAPQEFRRMCRDFATRYVDAHRRDFKRLGVLGQWNDPYLTMSNSYEAATADAFVTFFEKGYIYKGLKPVYWCIFDRTALAEAEVEYEDHSSHSIWVKFAVVPEGKAGGLGSGVSGLIWTTTPWTLPANRALAFHPEFRYVVAETSAGDLLVAADRVPALEKELGLTVKGTRGNWKGSELERIQFQHPFLDIKVPAVLGEHVTLDQGSGIVHTAPGHGAEDFYIGQKYGLDTYAPLDDDGRFLEGLPEYKGKTVFEANLLIIALLRARGALAGESKISHSYPHCWRCHNPVIFRATEQWFINLTHRGLRERALEEIAKVKWSPEWGKERIRDMIAERPDWCISRQRFWGVPLVIFYCEQCNALLKNFAALRNVIRWFEREGADAWYAHPAEELLPSGTRCSCGGTRFRKEKDILDVWFDSGSSSLAVLSEADKTWPADAYLEGLDQYRGWFNSSLLIGVGVRDRAPYRQVITHAWALDADGHPMSKSLGNVILPRDICDKWGAELLRIWVSSQDYHADIRMSDNVMNQLSESYRKLRNTFRYFLGNLNGFDPTRDSVRDAELWEMDAWMMHRTGELVRQCREWYDKFEFHRVFHAVHDFCVVDLSAFYFDVLKDRLYTFAPRNMGRRSAQTALFRIANALLRLIAPIMVFTAEEIWQLLPQRPGDPESIHMSYLPAVENMDTGLRKETIENWERMLTIRRDVLSALESARNKKVVAGALEAEITIYPRTDLEEKVGSRTFEVLQTYLKSLPALFLVSQVRMADYFDNSDGAVTEAGDLVIVGVQKAKGKKCERCWNYSTQVGANHIWPTVCERCVAALEEIQRSGGVAVA